MLFYCIHSSRLTQVSRLIVRTCKAEAMPGAVWGWYEEGSYTPIGPGHWHWLGKFVKFNILVCVFYIYFNMADHALLGIRYWKFSD